ncbi:MAG: divalent metal cation transporter [Verrucomicrobiota bacterium]|jgi:NRAMP (natural resistance-associated macrophage protein)-like metal ion transporter
MYWISKSSHRFRRLNRRTLLFLAALGPGIITMIADNDAGGISTYAQTGAKTGFSLLWAMIILIPMAYYVQEMTVRLGAVTKRGHAEAIFDGFGKFWGWFSIFDLAVINWLTLVTEYIGMTQAMSLFNIPPWATFFGVTAMLTGIVISGRYWTFEKITLIFCLFNLVYIPAAFWAMHTGNVHEGWSAVGKGFYNPNFKLGMTGVALLTLIMANIGTTITPWQIFFQQSAVVDKGMDVKQIKYGKFDTLFGSFMTCVVAAFIIIATAGVFHHNPANPSATTLAADSAANHTTTGPWSKINPSFHSWQDMDSAAKTAAAMPQVLHGQWGQWARVLFAIGLFDAGLLGALCISLATSWAMGEVFGWAHALNRSVREAPWFYVAYAVMLMSAGVVSLIASIDLQNIITIFVQVVAVTLLPAALMFLILLLNDKPLMGDYVNTRWQNIANWSIAAFVIVISTAYGISVLFPEWFGAGS